MHDPPDQYCYPEWRSKRTGQGGGDVTRQSRARQNCTGRFVAGLLRLRSSPVVALRMVHRIDVPELVEAGGVRFQRRPVREVRGGFDDIAGHVRGMDRELESGQTASQLGQVYGRGDIEVEGLVPMPKKLRRLATGRA